jgi:hypothetical protein
MDKYNTREYEKNKQQIKEQEELFKYSKNRLKHYIVNCRFIVSLRLFSVVYEGKYKNLKFITLEKNIIY